MRHLAPVAALALAACGGTEANGKLLTPVDTVVLTNFAVTPAPQTLTLSSSHGTASWTMVETVPWLTVSPLAGASLPATFTVTAVAANLSGGAHEGILRVTAQDHDDLVLPVRLLVPAVQGHWVGVFSSNNASVTLDLILSESAAGVISGTGSIIGGGNATQVTISGTHVHPNVSIHVAITGFLPADVAGAFVTPTGISAAITGSGFTGEAVSLLRQ